MPMLFSGKIAQTQVAVISQADRLTGVIRGRLNQDSLERADRAISPFGDQIEHNTTARHKFADIGRLSQLWPNRSTATPSRPEPWKDACTNRECSRHRLPGRFFKMPRTMFPQPADAESATNPARTPHWQSTGRKTPRMVGHTQPGPSVLPASAMETSARATNPSSISHLLVHPADAAPQVNCRSGPRYLKTSRYRPSRPTK